MHSYCSPVVAFSKPYSLCPFFPHFHARTKGRMKSAYNGQSDFYSPLVSFSPISFLGEGYAGPWNCPSGRLFHLSLSSSFNKEHLAIFAPWKSERATWTTGRYVIHAYSTAILHITTAYSFTCASFAPPANCNEGGEKMSSVGKPQILYTCLHETGIVASKSCETSIPDHESLDHQSQFSFLKFYWKWNSARIRMICVTKP